MLARLLLPHRTGHHDCPRDEASVSNSPMSRRRDKAPGAWDPHRGRRESLSRFGAPKYLILRTDKTLPEPGMPPRFYYGYCPMRWGTWSRDSLCTPCPSGTRTAGNLLESSCSRLWNTAYAPKDTLT